MRLSQLTALSDAIRSVIKGDPSAVDAAIVCLLAGGHLLLEDVPGVGKTMLARSLAAALDVDSKRIQFTPDMLPSDITGVNIYNQQDRVFELRKGPAFTNILLADEINRATPKTQSALLEVMAERQLTIDGESHRLNPPFMVIATQNPMESEGTYNLPAAQLDRFLIKISIGLPDVETEVQIMHSQTTGSPIERLRPVLTADQIRDLISVVEEVHVSEGVLRYIALIADATRKSRDLEHGISPRASIGMVRAARAAAAFQGRDFVTPEDVKALTIPVFAHRVVLSRSARMAETRAQDAVLKSVESVKAPVAKAS